ncbi:MAG: CBS domain-containing protein, partial [Myxococcota bacterium]
LANLGDRTAITVDHDVPVTEAIGLLKLHGISTMPVLKNGQVVGVIHENRLLEAALGNTPVESRCGDLADSSFCTVGRDTEVAVLSDLMRRMRLALVMDDGGLTAVLSRIDIIDHVARCTATR